MYLYFIRWAWPSNYAYQFKNRYSVANERQRIWELIFNIDHVQRKRIQGLENDGSLNVENRIRTKLGYEFKINCHMISVLFETALREV